MTIESRLGPEQVTLAETYLERLRPQDRVNVERVLEIIDLISEGYDVSVLRSSQNEAIVGAYAIGGWVNKEGVRDDVDLLVVTNALWEQAGHIDTPQLEQDYVFAVGDSFIETVAGHFRATGYGVEVPDVNDIPNEYSRFLEPRTMLRITPPQEADESPLDIVYISAGYSHPDMATFEDFYMQDSLATGSPAGRIALRESIITTPVIEWRL
jgi:hypothetical protein